MPCACLALLACGTHQTGTEDVLSNDSTLPGDGSVTDGSLDGSSMPEGGGGDGIAGETSVLPDARGEVVTPPTDVPVVNPDASTPCNPTGLGLTLAEELRNLARPVFVRGAAAGGFAVSTLEQRSGTSSVWLRRYDAMAASQWEDDVVLNRFNAVGAGGLATDGTGWFVAYNTNAVDNNQEVFAQRVDAMGVTQGTPFRLSNSRTVIDELAQVVSTASGHVVVWRTTESSGQARLLAAGISNAGVVGAVQNVTPDTLGPAVFDVSGDGNQVAVVFVGDSGATRQVYVRRLDGLGVPTDSGPTAVTAPEVLVSDGVAAALRSGVLAVAWVAPMGGVYLHGRTFAMATAMTGAIVDLSPMDVPVDQPGMDLDGTGYVLAFRARMGMSMTSTSLVQMLRLTDALAPRDAGALSTVAMASAGGGVRVAASGSNSFLVGWSDVTDSPMRTQVRAQWMRCN